MTHLCDFHLHSAEPSRKTVVMMCHKATLQQISSNFASMKPDTKNRINSPLFQGVGRKECYFGHRGSCTTHAAPRSAGIDHPRV